MPDEIQISPFFAGILRKINFTPEMVFQDPRIKPWRTLSDRENCTWDVEIGVRWHVKRFPSSHKGKHFARLEAEGYRLLQARGIPAAEVIAWGKMTDGRAFIITNDLASYLPADKSLESGFLFEKILSPTAKMAAQLHSSNLHHRDLYLCHFMLRKDPQDLRLIDAARVRELPMFPFRNRWVIKDLAQFWFSTLALKISDSQRDQWLGQYADATKMADIASLKRAVVRKSSAIAAHDRNLRRSQPNRNISIPR